MASEVTVTCNIFGLSSTFISFYTIVVPCSFLDTMEGTNEDISFKPDILTY